MWGDESEGIQGKQLAPGKRAWDFFWVRLATFWILGLAAGRLGLPAWIWFIGAAGASALIAWRAWRGRWERLHVIGWLAVMLTAAAWGGAWVEHTRVDAIGRWTGEEAQLARVRGTVREKPVVVRPGGGAFAQFAYWKPASTLFVLDSAQIMEKGEWRECSGQLLVHLGEASAALGGGEEVEIVGWLGAVAAPLNPGERDVRGYMRRLGIQGRLSAGAGNIQVLPPRLWSRGVTAVQSMRDWCKARAGHALDLGLASEGEARSLLQAMLLGRDGGEAGGADLAEVKDAFRKTGLFHLLSISGSHLSLLMALVWGAAWCVCGRPGWAAWLALATMGAYLWVLPMETPIVRSALMAGCMLWGWGSGRRVELIEMVALSCFLTLLCWPQEMESAGFQLSFGITAALVLFTKPLYERWTGGGRERTGRPGRWRRAWQWLAAILAGNLVGWAVATPVVAYHFGWMSLVSLIMSVLALPVVMLVLGLGFVKIAVGLVLPSGGWLLAAPMEGVTGLLIGMTRWGAEWRGWSWQLETMASAGWMLAALGTAAAYFKGYFTGRIWALAAALLLLAGILMWEQRQAIIPGTDTPGPAGLRLDMVAVGEGSCFLVRALEADASQAGGDPLRTLMFDCGSRSRLDIAKVSVVPALRQLGVKRIDLLLLSHVDIDHIAGALDLADAIPIGQVLVTEHFAREAEKYENGPGGFLLKELEKRDVAWQTIARGWKLRLGWMEVEMLWPAGIAAGEFAKTNDSSMVLSIRRGKSRVILGGDIGQEAMEGILMLEKDLQADVVDLPHHGSMVEASPRWLAATQPQVVLQSCGNERMLEDVWEELLPAEGRIKRLVTARQGMATVWLDDGGAVRWETFIPERNR